MLKWNKTNYLLRAGPD